MLLMQPVQHHRNRAHGHSSSATAYGLCLEKRTLIDFASCTVLPTLWPFLTQVLEAGIAFHSVLIGIALGVSNSPCTIRPLLAALTFHQFFEGIALGSCLLQVPLHAQLLCSLFSITWHHVLILTSHCQCLWQSLGGLISHF
jgi:zinc transporter 1/2/3